MRQICMAWGRCKEIKTEGGNMKRIVRSLPLRYFGGGVLQVLRQWLDNQVPTPTQAPEAQKQRIWSLANQLESIKRSYVS